jgi:hypothetical protein
MYRSGLTCCSTGRLNQSSRQSGGSGLVALDIDSSRADDLVNVRSIKPIDYVGATGDDSLDLLGFDAEVIDASTLQFYLINERPPVDYRLDPIDATRTGVNFTIEVFEYKRGEEQMKHLRTVFAPDVYSPNNVAAVGNGAFVISNDHSQRVGFVSGTIHSTPGREYLTILREKSWIQYLVGATSRTALRRAYAIVPRAVLSSTPTALFAGSTD